MNDGSCIDASINLIRQQNSDGGWGGDCYKDATQSSVEETAIAFESLVLAVKVYSRTIDPFFREAFEPNELNARIQRALEWLIAAVESGRFREPAPIGFYFAKLWYFEKLYPLIFTVAALGAARRHLRFDDLDHDARDVVS
jgi:squalene-hopene/tetraprenyl-beta-curcumene cyclase